MEARDNGIDCPVELERMTRNTIAAFYEAAVENVSSIEYDYVGRKLDSVKERLGESGVGWERKIATYCDALVATHDSDDPSVGELVKRYITAALFYVCNPFDIIPDSTPLSGFADDALVINLCSEKLCELCPEIWARKRAGIGDG